MACGVLLVTHGQTGQCLVDTLMDLLGSLPFKVQALSVARISAHDTPLAEGHALLRQLDTGSGVLLLTDAYGSTPSNIANKLAATWPQSAVVAGVNLPMLIRLANYPNLALQALAHSAVDSGQRGITLCPQLAIAEYTHDTTH